MPASITIKRAIIIVSTRRDVFTTGSRNARTPLLTASTPVIAVQPLAKDCSNNHTLAAATAEEGGAGGITTGTGCPPAMTDLNMPNASAGRQVPMHRDGGRMKMM